MSHFAHNINYQNTFLSDEYNYLNSPAFGVVPSVSRTVQMTTILSVTPRRYVYTYYSTLVWKFQTIAQHYYYWFCIPTHGPPHKVPLLHTLRARWGSRVYQFSGNTFARMTHWEIGKHPTSIIKTRVHYTYLIPRRGSTLESTVS